MLNPELKIYLHRRKKELKKTMIRLGYSARDAVMEPLVRGAHMLDVSDQTKFRLMSTTRGINVIRVPLSRIHTFIPNHKLEDKFVDGYVNVFGKWDFFWDGDWDQQTLSIDQHYEDYSTSYRSMMQRLREGRPFTECDEFIEKSEQIQREGSASRGNSIRELKEYFNRLDQLILKIQAEGYMSQRELGRKTYDEIGVFVGRDGSLIKPVDKFHGTHRFAIARYLELETVPVFIAAVHREWGKAHYDLLVDGGKKLEKHFR